MSPHPPPVFVDTHCLVALLNADDEDHAAAARAVAALAERRRAAAVSDWVLAEFLSGASRRAMRRAAAALVEDLRRSTLTRVVAATRADWDAAFALYRARPDKEWSFVDCTSIVICQRLPVREVLTHDHHFSQAGFHLLLG